jgi:steroid delta-isomerase-like uncharacterized protein
MSDSSVAQREAGSTATGGQIMQRFTSEFLTSGDVALAEEFLSPEVVLHFGGQEMRGRDTYLSVVAANSATFDELVWRVDEMVAEDDTVAIRYMMSGIHRGEFAGVPGTGRPVTAQSMAFYRLVDGQIVEERAQLDMFAILQQIGAASGTPQ